MRFPHTAPKRRGVKPFQIGVSFLFAQIAAGKTTPCSKENYSFPNLHGAQLLSITTSTLNGFKPQAGFLPEAALVAEDGVQACNVTISYTHPGHNDDVTVQLWLPTTNYNERYVGVGGGGWSAGEMGADIRSALASQGYAVATTNAGYNHNMFATADTWLMKNPGNLEYPLIVNFGHRALHDMTVISKHIIREAYGSLPKFSYWQGCSTGGRQGLTIAQRYPEDYDGLLTSCPAVNFSSLLVAMYWPQFIMNQKGIYPKACEFEAIVAALADSCGKTEDVESCDFDVASLIGTTVDCQGKSTIISSTAVEVYKALLEGPVDLEGNQLFPGVTVGTAVTGMMSIANTHCEGEICSGGRPFAIADDWIRLMVKKDPSFDPTKMTHAEYVQIFRDSVNEWDGMFSSNNPDLQRFRQLGKKMISWHSVNDEAVPVKAMRQYYDRVLALDSSRDVSTQDYYRYFEVPGATHCVAPAGVPYPLKALDTLRSWVEEGTAPESLPAVALGTKKVETKSEPPICVYPNKPLSVKTGYSCEKPAVVANGEGKHVKDEL
ncbi:hypothetical protein K4K59_003903 [Colletotrichum sp. SAR11_240]|nr:hypothetical protein K4K59_003903 [Colletotrichum sp. SAR11_240]